MWLKMAPACKVHFAIVQRNSDDNIEARTTETGA